MIGSFTLIKNEILWIERHIEAWHNNLDQMVFFDGNSTDGTLDVLQELADKYKNIFVYENKDPKDLQDDYVRLFNECLKSVSYCDLVIFLHPDMFPVNGQERLRNIPKKEIAASVTMRVFAGEPGGPIFEESGRAHAWKNIMRKDKPDLGLHYYGHYGAANEDMYFEDITGDEHTFHGTNFGRYPYNVSDSGCVVAHYSDVRPYSRRLNRMVTCLKNQGCNQKEAEILAAKHPRVTLRSGDGVEFKEAKEISHV